MRTLGVNGLSKVSIVVLGPSRLSKPSRTMGLVGPGRVKKIIGDFLVCNFWTEVTWSDGDSMNINIRMQIFYVTLM